MKKLRKLLKNAVFWSVILHIIFSILPLTSYFVSKNSPIEKKKLQYIDLGLVDQKDKILKRSKKTFQRRKQIANTIKTGENLRPKDSDFLSKRDQVVDRQTRAKKLASFKEAGKGIEKGQRKANKKKIKNLKVKKKIVAKKGKKKIDLKSLSMGHLAPTTRELLKDREELKKRDMSKNEHLKQLGSVHGKDEEKGLAANNDYMDDVPLGDVTKLNTSKFKYFGFYVRIRKKLEQFWGLSLHEKAKKLFRKGKKLSSNKNHITSLVVKLNKNGEIIKIELEGTSGIKELDDAAIESFNKAGPFPNPPKGMIVNGEAILQWGFVVKS